MYYVTILFCGFFLAFIYYVTTLFCGFFLAFIYYVTIRFVCLSWPFLYFVTTLYVAFPWHLPFLGRVGLFYVWVHPKGQPAMVLVLKGHSLKSNPTACWISNQGSN